MLVEAKGGNAEFARGVAMHVAAMNPSYNKAADVPAAFVEKEKEIELAKMSEKDKAKPPQILEKIIGGKIAKDRQRRTPCNGQPYVLNTDPDRRGCGEGGGPQTCSASSASSSARASRKWSRTTRQK